MENEHQKQKMRNLIFIGLILAVVVYSIISFASFFSGPRLQVEEKNISNATKTGIEVKDTLLVGKRNIKYDKIYGDDTDKDGIIDRFSYYSEGNIVLASWDNNNDKRQDQWFSYIDNAYVDQEAYDFDYNGEIDNIVFLDKNEAPIKELKFAELQYGFKDMFLRVILPVLALIIIIAVYLMKKKCIVFLLILCISFPYFEIADAEEIVQKNGEINEELFEKNWMTYSAINPEASSDNASSEAKSYLEILNKIEKLEAELFELESQEEMDKFLRTSLIEYKRSLLKGDVVQTGATYWQLLYDSADLLKSGYEDMGRIYDEFVYGYIELPIEVIKNPSKYFTEAYQVLRQGYDETIESWNKKIEAGKNNLNNAKDLGADIWKKTGGLIEKTGEVIYDTGKSIVYTIPDTIKSIQLVIRGSEYFANNPSEAYEYAKGEIEKALQVTYTETGRATRENITFLEEAIVNIASAMVVTGESIYENEIKSIGNAVLSTSDAIIGTNFNGKEGIDKLRAAADNSKPARPLTESELLVLRYLHIEARGIDDILLESTKQNAERRRKIEQITEELERLYEELSQWESKERERIRNMLIEEWQNEQDKATTEQTLEVTTEATTEKVQPAEIWKGSISFKQIFEGSGLTKEQRDAMAGQIINVEYHVTKLSEEKWSFYNPDNQQTFILDIQGEKISSYQEAPIPNPDESDMLYQKMTGTINKEKNSISGILETGTSNKGKMFIQNLTLRR